MRSVAAALLCLLSTSAMAATFNYVPVHVAPVVHIPPPVHVQPMVVRPALSTVRPAPNVVRPATPVKPGLAVVKPALGRHHAVARPIPVTVYVAPQNQACAHPKPGEKSCGKK